MAESQSAQPTSKPQEQKKQNRGAMITRIFAAAVFALLTMTAPVQAATIHWDLVNVTAVGHPNVTVTGSLDFNATAQLSFQNYNFTVSGLGASFTLSNVNASGCGGCYGPDSLFLANVESSADQQVALTIGGPASNGYFPGFVKGSFPLIRFVTSGPFTFAPGLVG